MKKMYDIVVVGAGSWGTALANMLSKNGLNVALYIRNKELYEYIKLHKENKQYLPDIQLSDFLHFTNRIEDVSYCRNILISVPVKFLRSELEKLKIHIKPNHKLICASKGLENDTFFRPSEIIEDVFGTDKANIAAVSGPNFAKEVAKSLPTATVLASYNSKLVSDLQKMFSSSFFRVYSSNDIIGVEIAGALKNIMAIAADFSDGLGFGNNAKAGLITRGLAEITRLGVMLGAKKETFMGLAGVGDLVLTCTGDLSRNRKFGFELSKNKKTEDILNSMVMVAEGVNTTKSVYEWSVKNRIDMPISHQVYKIIYEGKNPKEAAMELMERPFKQEDY